LEENKEHIIRLRQAVEETACRKILTPKDFDYLSELIKERLGERVSASTLKRIWGYITSSGMPRHSTLDVLAQFVGKKDWDSFCLEEKVAVEDKTVDENETGTSDDSTKVAIEGPEATINKKDGSSFLRKAIFTGILLSFLFAVVFAFTSLFKQHQSTSAIVLQSGQSFLTSDEYLSLFGIFDSGNIPWSQPLPHHQGIIIWGPEFHHSDWHNDGNPDSLMPTITEYWLPADTTDIPQSAITMRNADNYLRATSFNELRITFMKGLPSDTSYTFLGIYRLDTAASGSTHLVWQRVAKECDLSNLNYLEQLRY